ncbi:YycH protein [Tindallia magadiensis]|uniref:YycH protein n=1 Tax=Tindallia magadiensis TaxID=69895 RepID=A0A1I3GH76_9FIRM|nr:two-component system regulatory protein YycI [Tindallia magadiensis]SFI22865.1 YycH protein [Tindallia magadiensis]
MDWTKAKSILIAAFLITNIFLLSVLYGGNQPEESAGISDQYATQTIEFLQEQQIELRTALPMSAPSLNSVTVEYRFFPLQETAYQFLGEDALRVDLHTYENHKGRVTVLEEKILIYENKEKGPMLTNFDEEKLMKMGETFLQTHHLDPQGLRLEQIYFGMEPEYQDEPLHKLVYQQTYQNRFIGESFVHIYIGQRGIVAVEALLLENMRSIGEGTSHTMISAPEALLRTVHQIQQHHSADTPAIITDILPGYYFPLHQKPIAEGDPVESGTAVPAWKIVLKDGKTFYQEAF